MVMRDGSGAKDFTPRQKEVLALLAAGLTADEIGGRLGISPRTARAHMEVLKHKLVVRRSREIPAAFQMQTGIDPLSLLSCVGSILVWLVSNILS
jgi:DNA-binding CsgD family transcriptional regulator